MDDETAGVPDGLDDPEVRERIADSHDALIAEMRRRAEFLRGIWGVAEGQTGDLGAAEWYASPPPGPFYRVVGPPQATEAAARDAVQSLEMILFILDLMA